MVVLCVLETSSWMILFHLIFRKQLEDSMDIFWIIYNAFETEIKITDKIYNISNI